MAWDAKKVLLAIGQGESSMNYAAINYNDVTVVIGQWYGTRAAHP